MLELPQSGSSGAGRALDGGSLSTIEAPIVGLCRRLDGIPLAIELAAAGPPPRRSRGSRRRLGDRFRLLTGGQPTALPRHQTLRATLDWSYELLSEHERACSAAWPSSRAASPWRRRGRRRAATRCAPRSWTAHDLVAKSLVVVERAGAVTRYRLLETMRAYALEKLTESGELDEVARRHAEYFRDLFERAKAERETRSTVEWLAVYGWLIYNVRSGLDWAFSAGGDAPLGVALTAAAVPLWLHQSLLPECRGRAERALASLGPRSGRDALRKMQLCAALGVSLMHTKGAAPETSAAWTTVLELAERLGDTEYQLRALWALWHFREPR